MVESEFIVKTLKEEYGIEVLPLDGDVQINAKSYLPISRDAAARVSAALSGASTLLTNAVSADALGRQAYSITLNGMDILPNELWKKQNGSYISNLQGNGRNFGAQTDVNPIDNSLAKTITIANSVFTIAAMATSQYYLKNINDKLNEMQKTTKHILNFLEQDKQSKVESDLEIIQDIINNIDTIKDNKTLKAMKVEVVANIQREAKANIKFYKSAVNGLIDEYAANTMGGKADAHTIEQIKSKYYYYRICLQEYSLSRLVEVLLTETFEQKYLGSVKADLKRNSEEYKEENNHILTSLYEHGYFKIGTKAKIGLSNTLDFMGKVIRSTPLGKTEIDQKLINMGKNSNI